jgi:hypothetical protein
MPKPLAPLCWQPSWRPARRRSIVVLLGLALGCGGSVAGGAGGTQDDAPDSPPIAGGFPSVSSGGDRGSDPNSPSQSPGDDAESSSGSSAALGAEVSAGSGLTPPDPEKYLRCDETTSRGASRAGVRRLTTSELRHTLRALLDVPAYYDIETTVNAFPDTEAALEGDAYRPLHSMQEVVDWMEVAVQAAEKFVASDRVNAFAAEQCMQEPAPTEGCWEGFVRDLGRVVLRRPLSADEVSDLGDSAGSKDLDGAKILLVRLLMSPDFLFHIERGTPADSDRDRLGDHEVANRIAYSTTGSMPDVELRRAADAGELQTLDQVTAQVRRLLETPEAKLRFEDFVADWLHLGRVSEPSGFLTAYYVIDTGGGGSQGSASRAFRKEVHEFLQYVIWNQRGTFRDILTARIAFPRTLGMTQSYKVGEMTGDEPVAAPDHPGLLTRIGLLTHLSSWPSPILRGVRIRRQVLCDALPPPSFEVVARRLLDLESHDHKLMANHEVVTATTADPACLGCHSHINPLGFLFEGYDSTGTLRDQEYLVGPIGPEQYSTLNAMHPLPGPQSDLVIEPGLPTTYANVTELAEAMAGGKRAPACMVVRMLRDHERRDLSDSDACALADATQPLLEEQPVFETLVKLTANEDIFWKEAP